MSGREESHEDHGVVCLWPLQFNRSGFYRLPYRISPLEILPGCLGVEKKAAHKTRPIKLQWPRAHSSTALLRTWHSEIRMQCIIESYTNALVKTDSGKEETCSDKNWFKGSASPSSSSPSHGAQLPGWQNLRCSPYLAPSSASPSSQEKPH